MKKYLFLFTISPVQAFIAQARKAQDLFAGSLILSDLMKFAISEIQKNENNDIIFPKLPDKIADKEKYENSSATHRILAFIEKDNMKVFGDELERKIQNCFLETMAKPVWELYPNSKEQLKNYFSFYWAAKKYDENENHLTQYKALEKLLGGVKNSRVFNAFEEDAGRKCALNGELNVKFYRKSKGDKADDILKKNKIFYSDFLLVQKDDFKKISRKQLAEGEGLSAISFLKRVYENGKIANFPSTAKVALLDMFEKANENEKTQKAFCDFMNIFKWKDNQDLLLKYIQNCKTKLGYEMNGKEDFDDEYFYEENILLENFENNSNLYEKVKSAQKELSKSLKEAQIPLTKYYAIIQFDGDNMGKWLSGEFVEGDEIYHKDLSGYLSEFSKEASKYLIEPRGKAIYAGGDDFLGFVNIHHLFEVLVKLRGKFNEIVNKPIQDNYKEKFKQGEKHLTFSAGISIAHYKDPLSIAMNWASGMQDKAKENSDKNSFGIAVLKGSGEMEKAVLSFGNNEAKNATVLQEILKKLGIQKLEEKEFSTTFITNLNREFSLLMDKEGKIELDRELVYTELKRLIERAANFKENKKQKSKEFADLIIQLYEGKDFENFLSLLNVCDFLIRKTH